MHQMKVGLVGCGHISVAHLDAWRRVRGFTVAGVLDTNRELAARRAEDFGVPAVFESLDDMIAACDVIDICTPPHTHPALARSVLSGGRHLVIEKPIVTDVESWRLLRGLVAGSQQKLAVIHNLKYLHAVQVAKRWVDEGRIGSLIGITREFLTSPERDRMLVGTGHWSHRLPGGRWFETLPHELYLIHYFAGALELDSVTTIRTANAPAGVAADEVMITLKDDRCIASIRYSGASEQNKRTLTLHGTRGEIVVDILSDAVYRTGPGEGRLRRAAGHSFLKAGRVLRRMAPDRLAYLLRRLRRETPHTRIIRAFADSVVSGAAEATPLDEIEYVVLNCAAIGREIDDQVARPLAV